MGVCGNVEGQFWFLQLVLPVISLGILLQLAFWMESVPFGFLETKEYHYPLFTNAMPAVAEWQSYGTQLASQWLCSSKYFKIDKFLRVNLRIEI